MKKQGIKNYIEVVPIGQSSNVEVEEEEYEGNPNDELLEQALNNIE